MSNRDTDTQVEGNTEYDRNPQERGKWLSAIIGFLGLQMLIEVILLDIVPDQFQNDIIRTLLLAVGGCNYYRRGYDKVGSVSTATSAALIGPWLLATPSLFRIDATGATGWAWMQAARG